MAPWRLLVSSWTAVGRQMAAKTALEALLGSSWGDLGGTFRRLWEILGGLDGVLSGLAEALGACGAVLGAEIRQFGSVLGHFTS